MTKTAAMTEQPKWSSTIVAAYLRHRVAEELGESPKHGAAAELARKVNILPQILSFVRSGTRTSVGVDTFDAFGRYWGVGHDELLRQAHAWVATQPKVRAAAASAKEPRGLARYTDAELLAELTRRAGKRK